MEHHDPEQISLYLDSELEEAERTRIEEHLTRCERCRQTRDAFAAIRDRVRDDRSPADRLAQRRALQRILSRGPEPFWRRRVALPAPAFAALVVALALAVVLLAIQRLTPVHDERAASPSGESPVANVEIDPARFDRGNRLEIYVARHDQKER